MLIILKEYFMKVIVHKHTRPSFNLAVEEYLLKQTNDEVFMLWRNDRSVIVGRNQNTHAEINEEFIKQNNIPVIRRQTGGGAVFHDLGNLNYTFITRSKDRFNDYAYFSEVVLKTLETIGINAELSGRNDMLIDGKKFSGNAQCAFGNAVMHHGTLMFGADVSSLSDALKVNPLKIKSKGIASVRSRVTNISDHLTQPMSIEQFTNKLKMTVLSTFPDAKEYELTAEDIVAIKKLEKEKYATYEWNFGFKQEYTVKKEARLEGGTVSVCLQINDNKIETVKIYGDYFGIKDIAEIEDALYGTEYTPTAVKARLKGFTINDYMCNVTQQELCELIV